MYLVRSCPYPDCDWQHVAPDTMRGVDVDEAIRSHLDEAHVGWSIDEVQRLADELLMTQRVEAARAGVAAALATFMPLLGDVFETSEYVVTRRAAQKIPVVRTKRVGH